MKRFFVFFFYFSWPLQRPSLKLPKTNPSMVLDVASTARISRVLPQLLPAQSFRAHFPQGWGLLCSLCICTSIWQRLRNYLGNLLQCGSYVFAVLPCLLLFSEWRSGVCCGRDDRRKKRRNFCLWCTTHGEIGQTCSVKNSGKETNCCELNEWGT